MKLLFQCLGLIFSIHLLSCAETQEKEKSAVYVLIQPVKKDTLVNIEYQAELAAIQSVDIRSQQVGVIQELNVQEGQLVSQGQLLFKLKNFEIEQSLNKVIANIKMAHSELRTAELEAEHAARLVDKGAIGSSELQMLLSKKEIAQAKVEELRAEKLNLENQISLLEVRAPFSGFVNRLPYKKGSWVDPSFVLTSLTDASQAYAYFKVSEIDYLNNDLVEENQNQRVSLKLANDSWHDSKGIVELVESRVDRSSGTIAYRAIFDNKSNKIKDGGVGKVAVPVAIVDAVLIPTKSVVDVQGNSNVFVLDKDGKVKRRPVTLGRVINEVVEVKFGLTESEKIVSEGVQKLKDGESIDFVLKKNWLSSQSNKGSKS